jgi:hypothetical protein
VRGEQTRRWKQQLTFSSSAAGRYWPHLPNMETETPCLNSSLPYLAAELYPELINRVSSMRSPIGNRRDLRRETYLCL